MSYLKKKVPEHTKVYFDALGYDYEDPTVFVPSEISGKKAVDIHHIVTRENRIENLMALTRSEHMKYGEIKSLMKYLLINHRRYLIENLVEFDDLWFVKWIKHYGD